MLAMGLVFGLAGTLIAGRVTVFALVPLCVGAAALALLLPVEGSPLMRAVCAGTALQVGFAAGLLLNIGPARRRRVAIAESPETAGFAGR